MIKYILKYSLYIEILLLISCTGRNNFEIERLHDLNNELVFSTTIIESQNRLIYRALNDKLKEPYNHERAKIWEPKAQEIRSLAVNFKSYILELKKRIKSESNERIENFETVFDEDNKVASSKIFDKGNEVVNFVNQWENFVIGLLKTDSTIKKEFKVELNVSTNKDSTIKQLRKYFENSNSIEALSTLSIYENRCVIYENRLITYCFNKIPIEIFCGFGRGPEVLIYQNSNYLRPGEKLFITAGIAQFSAESMPNIYINGKKMELERNGSAKFNLKTGNKPGLYKIPVRVEFTNEEGHKQITEEIVEYEIRSH